MGLISIGIVKEVNLESDQILQRVFISVETYSTLWNPRGIDTKDRDYLSRIVQRRVSSSEQNTKTLALKFHK